MIVFSCFCSLLADCEVYARTGQIFLNSRSRCK